MLHADLAEGRQIRYFRSAAMRYVLQEWEVRVPIPEGKIDAAKLKEIETNFHVAHRSRYGFARENKEVEFVTLFVDAIVAAPPFRYQVPSRGTEDASEAIKVRRPVFVDETAGPIEVPVYDRLRLRVGNVLCGPCLIE